MGVEAETEAMDPARVPLAASGYFVASSVFDSLVTLDGDGKPVPFLATSIEPSDGDRTWTIKLPKGVTFHNGDPLDAAAVKAGLDFYQKSAITSALLRTVTEVQAPDDQTVVVKLSEPWHTFPVVLTTQVGYVMHPSMIDDPQKAFAPIGTGPFAFDAHVLNESWKLKKNPGYWRKDDTGRALPYLDSIEFKAIPDETARIAALEAGDLDMIHTVKPDQVIALRQQPEYKRVEYAEGEKDFLTLNTDVEPFDDPVARRAVARSIDTERWRQEITKGVKQPVNSPFGPNQPGHSESSGYPTFDLGEAKRLVTEYQATHGKPLAFTYTSGEDPSDRQEAQLLASMMTDAGMQVTIKSLSQAQLIAHVVTGEYQVSIWRNFGMPDPDADTVWWRSESILPRGGVSLNTARFEDDQIDAAIDAALAAETPAERDAEYQKVARRMGEMVPYVWLGRVVWNLAADERVNGIGPAANGSLQTLGEKSWIGDLWIER
jgi:ABC-type transport system substrate-binding protein